MYSRSENPFGITEEPIPPQKPRRSNFIVGGQFRSIPFFDLSQTGEGPSLNDEPTDVEKLSRDLNQLTRDSKRSRRLYRK